jgi:hypothetical protein
MHSNNKFKPEFELQHNKLMHQHVCNTKLLYFIIELRNPCVFVLLSSDHREIDLSTRTS